MTMTQPSYFISHGGGPCFFMDWDPPAAWHGLEAFLRGIPDALPEPPRAVLVVSAHWEEEAFTFLSAEQPELLYDYFGFPRHTYQLTYPAANALDVVARAEGLMGAAGIGVHHDVARGFDHGVFVPLKLMFPAADVPVAQLSLRADLDVAAHFAVGRALAPLRREGVLIVGSGYSFHNLHAMDETHRAQSEAFDEALTAAACAPSAAARAEVLAAWEGFPYARLVHPREEHLIPLMVAAGAGGDDAAHHVFSEPVLGVRTSAYRFG